MREPVRLRLRAIPGATDNYRLDWKAGSDRTIPRQNIERSPEGMKDQPKTSEELDESRAVLRSFLERGHHYIVIVALYDPHSETDILSPYVMLSDPPNGRERSPSDHYFQWLGGHARNFLDYDFSEKQSGFLIGGGGYNKTEELAEQIMTAAYGVVDQPEYRVQSVGFVGRFARR